LFYGCFASKSPEGRRYHHRLTVTMVVFFIAAFALLALGAQLPRYVDVDRLRDPAAFVLGGAGCSPS
jgi:integral membrane sensor domain MASE1